MRVVPRRLGPRVSAAVLLGGDRQVQQRHEAPHVVVLVADDHEALRLQVKPALGDGRGCLALGGRHKLEDAPAVRAASRFGIVLPPHVPVDRRQGAAQIAKQELQVEHGALLFAPPRRFQRGVDVAADPAEEVACSRRGRASASRRRARRERGRAGRRPSGPVSTKDRSRSHANSSWASSSASASRRSASVVTRANAHTSRARRRSADRDDVDEPSQQRADEIGCRVQGRLPAAHDHVGEQRKAQRVTMGDLDEAVVRACIDPAALKIAAALLRTEVAQRHDSQELAPRGVGAPCRARQLAARDDRERGCGQAGQQPRADPFVQAAQPLISIEQQNEPALRCGDRLVPSAVPSASRTTSSASRGDDGSSRPSSRTTLQPPASSASSAMASSRLVLPIPPGPENHNTENSGSLASRAARTSSSSPSRPTKHRRRRDTRTSPSVPPGSRLSAMAPFTILARTRASHAPPSRSDPSRANRRGTR